MHYPWWYVPAMTSPMLIAAISIVHVLVSHYAVGGGIFLALEVTHAHRAKDREYLGYLKRHAKFFVLLTVAFGAITGVGIWWTIGLASPLATETLIRTFVFGWATEWVFFIVEVTSAFLLLYLWDRMPQKTHLAVVWIYAVAAWISLVLITGITAFMLNSGGWVEHRNFWVAFFNPQFLPQTIARTGGALLLSYLYVYLHASLTLGDTRLKQHVEARSIAPAGLGAAMIIAGGLGALYFLPPSARATLDSAAVLNIFMGLLVALAGAIFLLLYLGPYRNPGWLSPGFALSLCFFGIAALSTSEFVREAIRKPFVVYNVVMGNQVLPEEVAQMRQRGYLESGVWTKAFVAENYPQAIAGDPKHIDCAKLLELPPSDRVALGHVLFMHHCNDCHAADVGYSAAGPLLRGFPREKILSTVKHLETKFFMPPWCGTAEEAELITDYLVNISQPRPEGMRLGLQAEEVK
jgi:cytochrome bd-type quinol oxidase subunit 1